MFFTSEIRSTKSWVKLPKSNRLFEEESAYESISSLEPANHEFETYTRTATSSNLNSLNTNIKSTSVDYGFESSNNSTSPSTSSKLTNSLDNNQQLKHSTLNVNTSNQNNNVQKKLLNFIAESYVENKSKQNQENNLYKKLLEKLQKSSIDLPANIPLLCVESFNKNDQQWTKLNMRFISSGINIRLVEINKGVPINALFYLSDLDMIYVKTYNLDGDDLEGYVPRQSCKPINSKELKLGTLNNYHSKSTESNNIHLIPGDYSLSNITNTNNTTNLLNSIAIDTNSMPNNDDSIKYHSLSTEMEYDNINSNQEDEYAKLNENNNPILNPVQLFNENKSNIINERRHSLFSVGSQRIQDCFTYEINNLDMIRSQLIKESTALNSKNNNNTTTNTTSNNNNNNYSEISAINSNNNENNHLNNIQSKRDLTHFSVTNYQLVNDYEETNGESLIENKELSPKSVNKCLLNMQSRSRLPISIRSNLNLGLIDEKKNRNESINNRSSFRAIGFNNFTYKSPLVVDNGYGKNSEKKPAPATENDMSSRLQTPKDNRSAKNARRSLDSSLANGYLDPRLYSVSIDIDELKQNQQQKTETNRNEQIKNDNSLFSELDIKKIELDSLQEENMIDCSQTKKSCITKEKEMNSSLNKNEKIWTVILKHEAKNFQEITVVPGMMVMVIKEYGDWIYVKLVGFEKSNLELAQQHGMIPRSCAIDLQEIIYKSALNLNNLELNKRRKSQITAL